VLNPTLAAFVHVASEMTFILNSARLLPRAGQKLTISETIDAAEPESMATAA
jgi:Cd2+/Zn2+-exporting ATPase/Cu+-exporting ATPase